jgi:hypothetical protein
MRTLIGAILLAAAAQVYPQSLEADLDGNASALQASELRPAPKAPRPQSKEVAGRQSQRS